MPRRVVSEELEPFLHGQPASALSDVLLELAAEHPAVLERLKRLQVASQPKALSAFFRKSLTAWRRSKGFLRHAEAREFVHELHAWIAQVERELLPRDPAAALELAESFARCSGGLGVAGQLHGCHRGLAGRVSSRGQYSNL